MGTTPNAKELQPTMDIDETLKENNSDLTENQQVNNINIQ